MDEKIKEALGKLDPKNDNHWTADGAPRIETLRMLTGTPSLTRDDVLKTDQAFNREAAQKAVDDRNAAPLPGQPAVGENIKADGTVGETTPSFPEVAAPPAEALLEVAVVTDDEVANLRAKIADGESYLNQLRAEREEADKHIYDVEVKLDVLKNQIKDKEPGHLENMATIQAYLAQSQRKREERAGLARESAGKLRVPRIEKEAIDQRLESRPRDKVGNAKAVGN